MRTPKKGRVRDRASCAVSCNTVPIIVSVTINAINVGSFTAQTRLDTSVTSNIVRYKMSVHIIMTSPLLIKV